MDSKTNEQIHEPDKPKIILIIGISGGLAQLLAKLILKENPQWKVIGVDSRSTENVFKHKNLTSLRIRFSRGSFENLFRDYSFDYVYHLARISSSSVYKDLSKRLELNVMGTNRILDLCHRFDIKKIVVLSTFHVYGALDDNGIFLKEDSPLRASIKYPELRDVVEMDQVCSNWMWKYQNEVDSVLLRPCNIIGSQIANTMTRFLSSQLALRPIDYNPVFQFIHEFDMAMVLYRALNDLPTGIYNVATDEFIPLRKALDTIGSKGIPFPVSLATAVNKALKISNMDVPEYLIDYLKFSCLIDNSLLKQHLGESPFRFNIKETLNLIRLN